MRVVGNFVAATPIELEKNVDSFILVDEVSDKIKKGIVYSDLCFTSPSYITGNGSGNDLCVIKEGDTIAYLKSGVVATIDGVDIINFEHVLAIL